jgi:hypothetical protein
VLEVAYVGVTGPVEAYKILATYYSAASSGSVVVLVPVEGIYSSAQRSDIDSNTMHSVASLAAGFRIGTIPAALANSAKCGVRMRGFIRGPMTGTSVYTFTISLNVSVQSHVSSFCLFHSMQENTDRARAWVDNVSTIV